MTTPVVVTMFFNLKKLQDATTPVRPSSFYETNCVATLGVKVPLVVFCDEETRSWIEPMRKLLSDAPTQYVVKPIHEYDHYKDNYSIVVQNRKHTESYVNDRNTASHSLTTTFKIHAIRKASELYPEASHYFWIDFGCMHVVWEAKERIHSLFDSPHPKVSVTYIHYRSSAELYPIQRFLKYGGPCGIAAGVFSVEKSYVNVFYTRFMSLFYEILSNGVGHAEEQVLTYMYDRYPDMFTLTYGDYYSLISNYTHVVRDYNAIKRFFIENALRANRKDIAETAAKTLLKSYTLGYLRLESDEVEYLKHLASV